MIYVGAGLVVFFGIVIYVAFMVFLPEWVGITGKTALKNEADHRGESVDSAVSTAPENKNSDPNSSKH